MKITWMAVGLIALISMESGANGQLIPRRNTTRPCPAYRLPQAEYQVDDRSRSVVAFSYRFIYLDDPLDTLNQQPGSGLKEKTEITTISSEKAISPSNAESMVSAGFVAGVSAAISVIDDARILAQQKLVLSRETFDDISAARAEVNAARNRVEQDLRESGMTREDLDLALTAVESARSLAEETLLSSVQRPDAGLSGTVSQIRATRSLLNEKLAKSGKLFAIEAARLRRNASLLEPGKTEETIKKKTQVFDSSFDSMSTVQRDQKLFQWSEDRLKIDHCQISNMAVQLSRNGEWRLNLRADQNRRVPSQRFNPSLHIKRNQFGILLRCYGNMDSARKVSSLTVGQPVLAEIKVDKFWVQNGKPNFFVTSKNDPLVAQNFDSIDRVEIEFFYYK